MNRKKKMDKKNGEIKKGMRKKNSPLFPCILAGCLALTGAFLPFLTGTALPDPAIVYADETEAAGSAATDPAGPADGNAGDDFQTQTDAAVRSAQPDAAEGDSALAPAGGALVQTDGSGTDPYEGGSAEDPYADTEESGGTNDGITPPEALPERDRMLPDGETPDDDLRVGDGDPALPAWYPKDPLSFPFYHDENAPRVIDIADIFTDEEEQQMEARLAELRPVLGKDIVILADVSTYGFSRSVYAADFYDFNGYGIGPDREGVCLMICMEPGNRGWWCCCTGPVTKGLYNETVANQIDDMLYEYMKAGEYGTGVADWIENIRRLYMTGSPYSEEWAVIDEASFTRFHDGNAPRVVDDAKILTDGEIGDLTGRAAALSEKYGVDVVIHTALSQGILDRDTFSRRYFLSHGYGFSDGYDGIQLTIFKRPGYTAGVSVYASGKGLDKLSEVNKDRLESRCESLVSGGEYYEGASQWLDQTAHMLRTGRAPRSSSSWGFTTILEMLAGLLFGSVSLGKAKKQMATPKMKENANAYIVKNSIRIRNVADRFLHSTVNEVYSPVKRENSDSGGHSSGGGSSTFHSSYSGSSGSSHSGSGRDF